MNTPIHHIQVSRLMMADTQKCYAIVADYRNKHPLILPGKYFSPLTVEAGGYGAGTVVSFEMRALGEMRKFRMAITEPQPSHVLEERDLETGITTTFVFEPIAEGRHCHLSISTRMAFPQGIKGEIERRVTTRLLKRIHNSQLTMMENLLKQQQVMPC